MTDTKLPPLPPRVPVDKHLPTGVVIYGYTNDMMCDYARDYARANVAAKDAEIEALRAEVERLAQAERDREAAEAECARLLTALGTVADWNLPETGETWPSGYPISFEAQYGSNGVRDYMRAVARKAIDAARTKEETK